jgi:hypothetical protein
MPPMRRRETLFQIETLPADDMSAAAEKGISARPAGSSRAKLHLFPRDWKGQYGRSRMVGPLTLSIAASLVQTLPRLRIKLPRRRLRFSSSEPIPRPQTAMPHVVSWAELWRGLAAD